MREQVQGIPDHVPGWVRASDLPTTPAQSSEVQWKSWQEAINRPGEWADGRGEASPEIARLTIIESGKQSAIAAILKHSVLDRVATVFGSGMAAILKVRTYKAGAFDLPYSSRSPPNFGKEL